MAKERQLSGEWRGFYPGDWVRPRSNPGTWTPLIDVHEIFPGNRSVSREGVYNLYDAPVGVEHTIEVATKAPVVFDGEVEWEKEGTSGGDVWYEDGRYHMFYYVFGQGTCYAVSDDCYNWTRPELGEVEFNGSKKKQHPCQSSRGRHLGRPLGTPRGAVQSHRLGIQLV